MRPSIRPKPTHRGTHSSPAYGESPEEEQEKAGGRGEPSLRAKRVAGEGAGGQGTAAQLERLRWEGDPGEPDPGIPQPEQGRAKTQQM